MHTKFSGSNGQNAHRWLRTLRYENPQIATISPSNWLGVIDGLLEDDAATWADHHPRVKYILRAGSLKEATRADVETFKKALIARFPPVEVTISHSRPDLVVSSPILEQAPNEGLDSYYQRTLMVLYQRNGVDLAESPLTEQEHDALKKTISSHILGLADDEVREEAEKVWVKSQASLSLQQIHKLSKDKKLRMWLGEEQKRMENRIPGQTVDDQGLNRTNVPSSSFDNPVFLSDLGNVGPFSDARANFDYYFKPDKGKHAAGADNMRSRFADFMKDHPDVSNEMPTAGAGAARNFFADPERAEETPSSKYGPLPELRPWNPTNPTTSTWNQVRDPPFEKGFTSRIGNSNHTPNTSNGSNPPTTLPNANMFGGGTGAPSRPQSSLFGESPPYSIFDDRHPANVNRTTHPAYGTNKKFSGDGSFTGANDGNAPQKYSGMPPPGLSLFEPLTKKPTSSLFSGGPKPGRAAKGGSPNRHSRRPSNLEVETHLRPSSLSEDTVRQFYSPGRNIFGNFSTKSPSGVPDAADPNNAAMNTSASTSHQGPSIQVQPPSIFDTPDTDSSVPEDHHARGFKATSQASMDRFLRLLGTDSHLASNFNFHAPSLFGTTDMNPPVPEDGRARDTNNPFKDSMDQFMRELNLDTHPSDADIGPPHDNHIQMRTDNNSNNNTRAPSPPPKTPTTAVFSPPTHSTANASNPNPSPPVSYSQALNNPTHTNTPRQTHRPLQPTVESDPEPEPESEFQPEIPITIKQSQGQKKKRRGQGGIFKP